MRIIFMGTPGFAVPCLEVLVKNNYEVVAVVTAPDKPAGRGQKVQYSEVKQAALKYNLPVLQPEKLKDPTFVAELEHLNADLQIVVAFRMLPEVIWNMPPLGTFNLHASLLPQYRGAAPINWAVINGEKVTGVTTFFLQHEIDTGDILLQEKVKIEDTDNAGAVHDKLMHVGADLVLKTVKLIEKGNAKAVPQDKENTSELRRAPKIFREDCQLDFNQDVEKVHNKVRGLSPHPGAFFVWNGKNYKLFSTRIEKEIDSTDQIVTDGKKFLAIRCLNGYLSLLELQPENKKRMKIEEFLNGYDTL